jgi:amino acid adenylation domain-containing protein/FkbM family methyltransferase
MLSLASQGFRLSPQQKRVWSLQQESPAYQAQCAILLEGRLKTNALKTALRQVVSRHEILRTTFEYLPGIKTPLQCIGDSDAIGWQEIDRTGAALDDIASELRNPFDSPAEALSATLFRYGVEQHILLLRLSPLCVDEWTLSELVGEISRCYAEGEQRVDELAQYLQFSEWQNTLLEDEGAKSGRAYWHDQDLSASNSLRLPWEEDAPAVETLFPPATLFVDIDAAVLAKLEADAANEQVSLSTYLLACWQTLLWRLTKQPRIIVGNIADGRTYEVLRGALGLFSKWLPISCQFEAEFPFPEVVRQVHKAVEDGNEWQEYFTADENLEAEGSGLVFPFIVFSYEERPVRYVAAELSFSICQQYVCRERFHVRLSCIRRGAALKAEFHYDAARFSTMNIERLANQFRTLLSSVAENNRVTIDELEIVGAAERAQLMEWNCTAVPYAHGECVHELFERQAARTPAALALVYEEQQLSYGELNRRANQLAHYLIKLGVGPEVRVALCVERSVEMIVGLLGILKAGGAYVPLDPTHPGKRLSFMLADQAAVVLLTQQHLLAGLPPQPARVVCLDTQWAEIAQAGSENLQRNVQGENLAYVIYTSGSTGTPKGVAIEHRQLCNYIQAMLDVLELKSASSFATVSTLAADLGNTALYPALCSGGTLHVISAERAGDATLLGEYFSRHRIDVLKIVPSHLGALVWGAASAPVLPEQRLVLGGEATQWELVEKVKGLKPACRLLNHYGPTETTVGVLTYRWSEDQSERVAAAGLPLGRPLANTAVYLLDSRLRPVPIGVAGELYIGGAGVGRGYLNQSSLTAEKYLPDPFSQQLGARLYRTGDLGRYLADGSVEFLGRIDNQVKLRGYRIELAEIESALRTHEAVREAVVREDESGEKRLVGYVVPHREYLEVLEGRRRYSLPNGMMIVQQNRNETDYLYQEIFTEEAYFKHGIELDGEACVFDVGANIGMFTLYVSQHCPAARIYAFEPIKEVCAALRVNAELYGATVTVFNHGLSDQEREASFTFYPRQSMMSGMSEYADAAYEKEVVKRSMRNEQERGTAGMAVLLAQADELLADRFTEQREQCRLRRLSDVFAEQGVERIDLLKIDVQRAEMDVLQGIAEEDWGKIKQIVMEVHDREGYPQAGRLQAIGELLRGRGFGVVTEQEAALAGTDRYNLYATRNGAQAAPAREERPAAKRRGPVSGVELRAYLRELLPDYMVPTWIVLLDELPLTPNGKVNRRALPPPEQSQLQTEQSYVAPRTQTEEMVSGVWTEVLGLARVSVEANFFDLGGHSLLATLVMSRLKGAFGVELHVRSLFETPTVRLLSAMIEQEMTKAHAIPAPPITPVPRDVTLPLSFAQQRLWFIDQLEPMSAIYNIPAAVRLKGRLDLPVLEQTLSEIVRRHEALRTRFESRDGEPVQLIEAAERIKLDVTDLAQMASTDREIAALRLAVEEANQPFDLSRGPMLRASLLRLGETEHVVLFTMHHIASDGWSKGLLVKEVASLYSAYIQGLPSPLPELSIQYADFAHWQRNWLQGEVLEEQLSYWRAQLADAPALLELPTDRPRPAVQGFHGAHYSFVVATELSEQLQQLGRREGVTLFMTLLAAWQTLLAKYSNQEDIVVGTDIANRNRAETEGLIGFFVNQLVLRTNLSGNPRFNELLRRVREVTLGAYAHQDMPFEKLVEMLNPDRGVSRTPLFQVKLVLQNASTGALELSGLTLEGVEGGSENRTAKFDLMLTLVEQKDGLSGTVEYSSELFEAATIVRMTEHFQTLLGSILARPDARLNELEYLTASEAGQREAEKKKHEQSKFKKFKSIKPKAIDSSRTDLVKLTTLQPGKVPLVMEPNQGRIDLADWLENNLSFVETNLRKHGGILFRGFELYDEADFEGFLSSLPSKLMRYMEGATPRTELRNKIYTSTEYPADQSIALHNELTYVTSWPMKIWFFCVKPAEKRGETPIADVRNVFNRIDPRIRQQFMDKGWMLVRNFGEGLSLPWQTSFHTTERAEVEAYCRGASIEFEWKDNGDLRTRQVRPAIARHPVTAEEVWFNHVAFWHVSSLEKDVREAMLSIFKEDELPYNTYFGDGSRIEDSVVENIREAYDAEQVEFGWQRGDLLMLDNMLVAHGRNPFEGTRKIIVAMGEKFSPTAD